MNVASFVLDRARTEPDAPAIYFPAGRREGGRVRYARVTNRELDLESDAIARGLASAGIVRGTRTALMVKPSLELFALTLGLFKLGAVPVMVDPGIGRHSSASPRPRPPASSWAGRGRPCAPR